MTEPLHIQRTAKEGDYLLLVFPRTAGAGFAGKAAVLRVVRRMALSIVYPLRIDAGGYRYGVVGSAGFSVQNYGEDMLYTEDVDTVLHVWPAMRAKPSTVAMYVHYTHNAPPLNISDRIPAPSIPINPGGTPVVRTQSGALYDVVTIEDLDPKDPKLDVVIPPYVHVGFTVLNTGDQPVDASLLLRVYRYQVRPATSDEAARVAERKIPPQFIHVYSLGGTVDWDVPQNLLAAYAAARVPLLEL